MRRLVAAAIGLLLVVDVALLATDRRILIGEALVSGPAPYLSCRYFTGRSVRNREWHYSSNGIMGRDSCPLVDLGN